MTFQIGYLSSFFGTSQEKTVDIEADSKESALTRFFTQKQGIKQGDILSVIERKAVPPVVWTNPETGKSTKFYPVVNLLKVGQDQAITTSNLLTGLGYEDTDSNRRLLRAAIDYYLIEEGVQICVTLDGYFIASSPEDLISTAEMKEKRAESLLQSAARMRERAKKMTEVTTTA